LHTGRIFALALGAGACSSVGGSDPSLWKPSQDLAGTHYQVASPEGTSAGAAGNDSGGETRNTGGGGGAAAVFSTGGATVSSAGGALASSGGRSGTDVAGTGGIASGGAGGGPAGGTSSAAGGTSPGGGGSVGAAGDTSGTPTKCTFSFDVTTVTAHGRFAPSNAGAVWISDAQNKFVKTLRWWGLIYVGQATAWVQATGSNKVDAVSGATRKAHGALNATWDCTDVSRAPVADGSYAVHVTFAEADAPFAPTIQASVPFTKSASGADVTGQDTANFTSMHAKLTEP
jgi:hypothetical protein